jgi:hypothetical protein
MTTSETLTAADALLAVVINGQSVLEYDRRKPLPARQKLFLDNMDRDMDAGITLNGQRIAQPDPMMRARFVANHLVQAAESGDGTLAAAACAYLAVRLPGLKQVRADSMDGQLHIDLVFDKPYEPVQAVQFVHTDTSRKPH